MIWQGCSQGGNTVLWKCLGLPLQGRPETLNLGCLGRGGLFLLLFCLMWPQLAKTCYVDQADSELRHLPVSAF